MWFSIIRLELDPRERRRKPHRASRSPPRVHLEAGSLFPHAKQSSKLTIKHSTSQGKNRITKRTLRCRYLFWLVTLRAGLRVVGALCEPSERRPPPLLGVRRCLRNVAPLRAPRAGALCDRSTRTPFRPVLVTLIHKYPIRTMLHRSSC